MVHTRDKSHHIAPNRDIGYGHSGGYDACKEWLGDAAQVGESHEFPDAVFDELAVGRWCHIEQMDTGLWWMNIGGVTVHVKADRDGRPRRVRVDMPGFYDEPVQGCEYRLNEQPYEVGGAA